MVKQLIIFCDYFFILSPYFKNKTYQKYLFVPKFWYKFDALYYNNNKCKQDLSKKLDQY
jgi:hypothetical protein